MKVPSYFYSYLRLTGLLRMELWHMHNYRVGAVFLESFFAVTSFIR